MLIFWLIFMWNNKIKYYNHRGGESSWMDWSMSKVIVSLPKHILRFDIFQVSTVANNWDLFSSYTSQLFSIECICVEHRSDLINLSKLHRFWLWWCSYLSKRMPENCFVAHIPNNRHSINRFYLFDCFRFFSSLKYAY